MYMLVQKWMVRPRILSVLRIQRSYRAQAATCNVKMLVVAAVFFFFCYSDGLHISSDKTGDRNFLPTEHRFGKSSMVRFYCSKYKI